MRRTSETETETAYRNEHFDNTTQHSTAKHSTAKQNTTRRVKKNTHNKHVAKVFFISFFFHDSKITSFAELFVRIFSEWYVNCCLTRSLFFDLARILFIYSDWEHLCIRRLHTNSVSNCNYQINVSISTESWTFPFFS